MTIDEKETARTQARYQRMRVEKALQGSKMEKAISEKRNRLARDLHDSVTQSLFAITMYADAAERQLSKEQADTAAGNVRKLRRTAREALGEMRMLIYELRPLILEVEGLAAALEERLEAVERRAGLQADLIVEAVDRLPPDIEEGLYRIAQESLNNVLKHARAKGVIVTLRLKERPKRVILEIADDGIGFDPDAAQEHGGLGLRGIAERAEHMGGNLKVVSKPGTGTTVKVEAQIKQ